MAEMVENFVRLSMYAHIDHSCSLCNPHLSHRFIDISVSKLVYSVSFMF